MDAINTINDFLWSGLLIVSLLGTGLYFTIAMGGVQFTMLRQMWHLLIHSGKDDDAAADGGLPGRRTISSFQAFAVSLAARVGTGNIAGVAIAIAIGGPGAVFWMWVVAIVGAANAFVECTLAQLFKERASSSYRGGPAYYIQRGLHSRAFAVTFAVLITLTFALAFNSVQSNTIALSLHGVFGIDPLITGVAMTAITSIVIFGGIQRIARLSEVVVPLMALLYIVLALYVIVTRIDTLPHVIGLIFTNAFGLDQAVGGGLGATVMMGVKRGLFSNEAGEGSTPNAAATASVTHPVKQGLIQALGVYVDTLVVCSATAFIILCSGIFDSGLTGIELTQQALASEVGSAASVFVAIAVLLFAFTSIIANYYYGETNLAFISNRRGLRLALRVMVAAVVLLGSVAQLDLVWALADITMALMTLCNLVAIVRLGRYARTLLRDYHSQLRRGLDPTYRRETLPELDTPAW